MIQLAQVVAGVCYDQDTESAHGRKKLDSELRCEPKHETNCSCRPLFNVQKNPQQELR